MRIEHSRKRGAFDPRHPDARRRPAPESLRRAGEEVLDWRGFRARFFADSRRHDGSPLAAYEAYRNDADGGHAASGTTPGANEDEAGARADTDRWEGEGGAPAGVPGFPE